MLEETRLSFFQLEQSVSNLDSKAFGLAAFDGILFTIVVYISSLNSIFVLIDTLFWYVPLSLFTLSLIFIIPCIRPRYHRGQNLYKTIKAYGTIETVDAAGQLAINYATLFEELLKIHKKKMGAIVLGLWFMIIGLLSMLIPFILRFIHKLS
jgi:hypothetical protein